MATQGAKPALAITENDRIGFFGKVPSHGDFISEGLEREFITALDEWIRAGMHACAEVLSGKWSATFLSSPPRRFIIERGVWGNSAFAGVLLPSKDRVGRKFPLVVIAQLTKFKQHPRSLYLDETWFMAAEALAETSMTGDFEMARFTAAIKRLRLPKPREDDEDLPISPARNGVPTSLWWHIDPESRKVRGVKFEGKPKTSDFVRLFQEVVEAPEKREVQEDRQIERQSLKPADTGVDRGRPVQRSAAPPIRIVYSYATHAGTRLSTNADSLFVSKDPALFALADGLGDSSSAIEAARLTTNIMADVSGRDPETSAREIRGKLGTVNSLLLSRTLSENSVRPMASVVTASFFENALTVLWSGDARAYLLKDGTMHLLTRDHVIVGLKRQLSQCIGHSQQFRPDVVKDGWNPKDRLLLCSAPLIQALKERTVAEIIVDTPIKDCANALVQEALIENTRENISAIVIGNTLER
ncbi:type VI secretion system-associated protein TagF [Agrobacterium larrymoorei]|uniref:type VI secretion system-associated protein TagF n=1 Tax=Agrobacterium larrymoorei TaxID=160699 RepID=UPI0015716505|nr:type VI secretion system-associated protein TagF [Agrobacterium larrymoorei]NTJ44596.1 type VI secretion system-associated protein TagF [Agrobacterium larrymoorei]